MVERRRGPVEATIDRPTASTKTKGRASLAQKLESLTCTKETTQYDAWIKSLSYRAITEEGNELIIKGPNLNVKDTNEKEYLAELRYTHDHPNL